MFLHFRSNAAASSHFFQQVSTKCNNAFILQADVACERIFTVNDVEHGGCKYGIINLSGLGKESLTVEMYDNLYFTNRKVLCSVPASFNCCILKTLLLGRHMGKCMRGRG